MPNEYYPKGLSLEDRLVGVAISDDLEKKRQARLKLQQEEEQVRLKNTERPIRVSNGRYFVTDPA